MKIEGLITRNADVIKFFSASIKLDFYQLDDSLVKEFYYKWSWKEITIKSTLTEEFINKFKNFLSIEFVCKEQYLSEDFIESNMHLMSNYEFLKCMKYQKKPFKKKWKMKIKGAIQRENFEEIFGNYLTFKEWGL